MEKGNENPRKIVDDAGQPVAGATVFWNSTRSFPIRMSWWTSTGTIGPGRSRAAKMEAGRSAARR